MNKKKNYTYPPNLPLFQFFRKAEAIRKNPIPFHKTYFETYGDTFSVRLGRKRRLMLSRDKEVAQYILKKNHKNYYKSKIQTNYLSKYLGNGLLTINGEFWLKQRRLIQPAFHKEKMKQLVGLMQQTIEQELQMLPVGIQTDVFPSMNRLAFQVVAKSLFHISASEETLLRLQEIIQQVQEFLVKEVRLPHKQWWFKLNGQVAQHQKLSEESRGIIKDIIEERKKDIAPHGDLLDMLLATRYEDTGQPMSTKQLIDEITILFVAGHETTANALSFTTFLLAKHPEIQQKVFAEVRHVQEETTDPITQISKLIYTKAVIDESMRLYPPAWITDRENLEDDTLTGYDIRKDTLVGISFYELHRNPAYWNDPEAFKPERFLGDNKKQTAGAYYPFGAGPRMCIGLGFAVYEMVLAISHMVSRYTLSTNVTEVTMLPLITLKPENAQVKFELREH